MRLSARQITAICCFAIVLVGAVMRLLGTGWDEGANLHPDERHMLFVISDTFRGLDALEPGELSPVDLWFDAERSPLNPRAEGRLYVYGEFPHLVVTLAGKATGNTGWPEALVLGRTIGAIVDSYTVLAVFAAAMLVLGSAPAALGAAALYAFAPLAIQQANFFTVDAWITAAGAWCLVAAIMVIRATTRKSMFLWAVVAGALAGLAVACKAPGVVFCGVVGVAVIVWIIRQKRGRRLLDLVIGGALSGVAALVIFRLASPFTFTGPGPFGLVPTEKFIEGYASMTQLVLDAGFPPNWQWMTGYGIIDALRDLALWALGPPISLLVVIGFAGLVLAPAATRIRALPLLAIGLGFGWYWLSGPVPALRYALPAFPALAIVGGAAYLLAGRTLIGKLAFAAIVALAFAWGMGMVTLHTRTVSRIEASRWLWLTTEPGTALANESAWDDGLPSIVRLPGSPDMVWPDRDGHFSFRSLELENPDSPEKAARIVERLAEADLMTISSERMRKPILGLPERFPMTGEYYALLASGELCFEPVYENTPGYPFLFWEFDDSGAQETWTIYDHPSVHIYRKQPCFDPAAIEAKLLQALDSGS